MVDGHALLQVLTASLEANCKIFTMVFLGVVATFNGVFDSKGISDMGRLVYRITLPSLLFSKILKEFSLDKLRLLYWLPVFCVLHALLAYTISHVLGVVLRISPFEMRVVLGSLMFGNVGALAIAVVTTLCSSEPLVSEVGPICQSRAVSYVAFYLITQNLLMFSWGEALLFAKTTTVEQLAAEGEDAAQVEAELAAGEAAQPRAPTREPSGKSPRASPPDASADLDSGSEQSPPRFCHSQGPGGAHVPAEGAACGSASAASLPTGLDADAHPSLRVRTGSLNLDPRLSGVRRASGGLKRQRFQTSMAAARTPIDAAAGGAGGVVIRRSVSTQHMHDAAGARCSPADALRAPLTGSSAGGGSGPSRRGSIRCLDGEELPATLSYAEIQHAASRVGLEVHAFHPLHHASTAALASAAEPADDDSHGSAPLLQSEPNSFAFVLARGATLRAHASVLATRVYSVLAGVLSNPPIQAALLAMVLAVWPPLKALLIGPDAPLRFLASAVDTLGDAQVPISMLMLSGSGTINYMKGLKGRLQAQGAEITPFAFEWRTELAIVVGRLLLLPAAGFGVFCALRDGLGVLPADPLLLLIVLIESAVPTGARAAPRSAAQPRAAPRSPAPRRARAPSARRRAPPRRTRRAAPARPRRPACRAPGRAQPRTSS